MQRSQERARAWPDNHRHELAGPGWRPSGQDHHTGWRYSSQESHAMLGKRETGQCMSGGLDVVDRWIALRRSPSGSRSGLQTCKSMEVPPQLSGHWAHGGLWRRVVGDWTCAWCDDRKERNIATAWSEDGGIPQWLADRNLTRGTPRAGPGAAIREEDQSESAGPPRPRHCDRDSLGPGTLRHPWNQRGGPSGKPSLRHQGRHGDEVAIHFGLE